MAQSLYYYLLLHMQFYNASSLTNSRVRQNKTTRTIQMASSQVYYVILYNKNEKAKQRETK